MGKKQDRALMAALAAAINKASAPSPFETQLTGEWNNINNWLGKKDYRNPQDAGVFMDYLPFAEANKIRQMQIGAPNGQSAAGVNNPNLYAAQKRLSDDQFAQDWGGGFEEAIGGVMRRKDSLANALQGWHTGRQNTAVQGAAMNLDAWRNRPKGFSWGNFLSGLINSGAGIAAAAI